MTLAAVDRLVHHSTIFEMNVECYRYRAQKAPTLPQPASQPVPWAICAIGPARPDRSGDNRSQAAAISPAPCIKPNPAPTASSLRGASQ